VRILHLSKFYPPDPGGLADVVAAVAEGAAAAGHEVRVVCARGWSARAAPVRSGDGEPEPERRGGVQVDRQRTLGIVWSQPVAPGYLPAARWPADVVHVHHPHPLADLATILRPRTPLIVTHHSDVQRQARLRALYLPLTRAVLRRATAIVVAADANRAGSRELGGFEARTRVISFGVDHTRFAPHPGAPRPTAFPPGAGATALFVGRLVGYKGLDILLRALVGTSLRVVIAGDGPLRASLEDQARVLGVLPRVSFAGKVADHELAAFYQAADFFVLPSTTPAEMFGIALVEAMACGKAVISTALPTGVREVNAAGVSGLEVPPGDPTALRAAMLQLAEDRGLRERLGTAARARVEERFTLSGMVEAHLRMYEAVSREQGAGSRE